MHAYSHHNIMFSKCWAQAEMNWPMKLHDSSTYQIRTINGVVGGLHSFSDWIIHPPNDSSHPNMMFPKSCARSEINCTRKLHDSITYHIRIVNGVVGVLPSLSDWIILKNLKMTPPTLISCSPSVGLDPKSIGH